MITAIAAVLVFVAASDGDTLVVRDESTGDKTIIRLAEIDAPERTQPYSQVSRKNLEDLCRNKSIEIKATGIDRYKRTVARVHCDGINVNWRQVEDGLAWCYPRYLKDPDACLPRETAAREAKRALWREPGAQPPWDYRAEMRQKQKLDATAR